MICSKDNDDEELDKSEKQIGVAVQRKLIGHQQLIMTRYTSSLCNIWSDGCQKYYNDPQIIQKSTCMFIV